MVNLSPSPRSTLNRNSHNPCQVSISGRIRSKAALQAFRPQLENFAQNLGSKAACVGQGGQLRFPKKKKILSPDEQCSKDLTIMFKKSHGQRLQQLDYSNIIQYTVLKLENMIV